MVLSEAREAAGDLVRAAEASWAGSLIPGLVPLSLTVDLLFRSQDLLERANDSKRMAFEMEVVKKASYTEIGSSRQMKAMQRREAIRDHLTPFEDKMAAGMKVSHPDVDPTRPSRSRLLSITLAGYDAIAEIHRSLG